MIHFIGIGLLVFMVNDLLPKDSVEENLIVIDDRVKQEMIQEFLQ